jgi:hypothetical protein
MSHAISAIISHLKPTIADIYRMELSKYRGQTALGCLITRQHVVTDVQFAA